MQHLSPQQVVRGGLLDDAAEYNSLLCWVHLFAVAPGSHNNLRNIDRNHLGMQRPGGSHTSHVDADLTGHSIDSEYVLEHF